MSKTNKAYDIFVGNKAVNLILLNDTTSAYSLLKDLYNSQHDEEMKQMTLAMMRKNKMQLLQHWINVN